LEENALGMIETLGLVGAIEAADAMLKAAEVVLVGYELSTGGLVFTKVRGTTAACQSAVDAGASAASKVGQLVSSYVIPNPHSDTEKIIKSVTRGKKTSSKRIFERMTVKELRDYARKLSNFPIKGREISSANKETLLKFLEAYKQNKED